jgi:hypothetical protein
MAAVARPAAQVGRPAPSLRIAVATPLTVAGRNFRPHERVRVTATVEGQKLGRALTASGAGRFTVVFRLGASRCDLLRVVAVRRSGAAVVLKRLPSPACSLG